MRKLILFCLFFISQLTQGQVRFASGNTDLESFIKQHTIYPQYSKKNCIQGTVDVSFKLSLSGAVRDAKVSTGIGTDLDDEALRLILLSSGKWKVPNDFNVNTVMVIPIKFVLEGYNCHLYSKQEVLAAISAYQAENGLRQAIINFYKNKGQASAGQEQKIIKLKDQLGINEEYLKERLDLGVKKISQGDTIGACIDFKFIQNMNSPIADAYLLKYCK